MPKKKKTPEAKFVESLAELFTPDQLSRIMYALVSLKTMERADDRWSRAVMDTEIRPHEPISLRSDDDNFEDNL